MNIEHRTPNIEHRMNEFCQFMNDLARLLRQIGYKGQVRNPLSTFDSAEIVSGGGL
jgi:hypothetical protein